MRIVLEIDERLRSSLDKHLATQKIQKPDADTGAVTLEDKFASAEDFLHDVVAQVVHQMVRTYPPDHLREHFVAARKAEDVLKAATTPKRVEG